MLTQTLSRFFSARSAVFALALLLLVVIAAPLVAVSEASEQSAKDFVASIYAPYVNPHSEGAGLDTEADYYSAFEPVLASLLFTDADTAWERRDLTKLGFDPFMDAREWLVTRLKIAISHTASQRAVATVTFDSLGQAITVRLDLAKLAIGWRISDIHAKSGDLRARYVKE
jgi:hypothetical protein